MALNRRTSEELTFAKRSPTPSPFHAAGAPSLPENLSGKAGLSHGALQKARNIVLCTLLADAIRTEAPHICTMHNLDYSAPAEMFACKSRGSSPRPVTYHRFASCAEAIRFAIEELPADVLFGTVLEIDDHRFDAKQIRRLYDSERYPLQRRITG